MPDAPILASFAQILQQFATCFTGPSMQSFVTLMAGWVLDLRRHTVTEVVRAAGAVGSKHISSYHRFFSRGRWTTDAVGFVLADLLVKHMVPTGDVRLIVDDTLGRHTGKRIAAASMHRDPLLSVGRRVFFHWGHVWVVLAIEVALFDKSWALPVLFRLHRSQKRCKAEKRPYRKVTEHARDLVDLLATRYPTRRFGLIGDAAFTNRSLMKGRLPNVHVIGRGRLDAALYAPVAPKRRGQMGRPRVRGERVASPGARVKAKGAPWKKVVVHVYGRTVTVRVLVIDALWYVATGSEIVRHVVVRDFPGHERDDVFVSTDPALSARTIIESFAKRWSLEVTFHETKGKLGFEDPQNRAERAVERTAPLAFVAYSLTVLWYVLQGQHGRAAKLPTLPWYTHKAGVTFSDMLATLRRTSWRERLLDPASTVADLRKRLRPLVDYVASAA
jgi:DDE superfamily endonuclease